MSEPSIEEKREDLFQIENANSASLCCFFKENMSFGSSISRLFSFDITVYEPKEEYPDKIHSFQQLMRCDTKLFDAILYQKVKDKSLVQFSPRSQNLQVLQPSEIGEALFCAHYCLMTRKNIPYEEDHVPIFFKEIFKNPELFYVYSKMLTDFDINQINRVWPTEITIHGTSPELRHKLSLGLLGHGVLDIFKTFVSNINETSQ